MTYETREQWLNAFMDEARPTFESIGFELPYNIRISVGFPSTGYRSNVIGECFAPEASADNHYEVFINPTNQSDARIADVLTHELVHCAVGIPEGHGKRFGQCARALGLEGKLTATIAGADWFNWAAPILEAIGPMPYAAIRKQPAKGKKKTYLLKAHCPSCGFTARITQAHVTPYSHLNCPNPDCDDILNVENNETEE